MKQIRIIIECKDEDEKEVEEFVHKMGEYIRGHYQQTEYGILSDITEKVFPTDQEKVCGCGQLRSEHGNAQNGRCTNPDGTKQASPVGSPGGTSEIKKDPNEGIDFSWGFKK